jgi:hypothetical protein
MTRRSLLLSLGISLLAPSLFAAIAELATFDEKVGNATAIVLGRCVKSEAHWDNDHRWILTYSTFRIEKAMKGAATVNELTIITPGGGVDGIHQETVGVPSFREGDERVLFIRNTRVGPTVLYFDQGTYDVTTGAHGERLIAPIATTLVKIDTQRGVAVNESEPVRTLQQFESDVARTLHDIDARGKLKMDTITSKRRQQAALGSTASHNRWIIAIAVCGIALASVQWRRS